MKQGEITHTVLRVQKLADRDGSLNAGDRNIPHLGMGFLSGKFARGVVASDPEQVLPNLACHRVL